MCVGKKSEVANPYESMGQYMHHEAPDELGCCQRERTLPMLMSIIFVAEGDLTVFNRLQTLVGDRDTMRTLDSASIRAVVDVGALAGLPPGRYNLPVVVESIPGVTVARVDPPTVRVGPR